MHSCPKCGRRCRELVARPTVTRCYECDFWALLQRAPLAPALYFTVEDSGEPDPYGTMACESNLVASWWNGRPKLASRLPGGWGPRGKLPA